MCRAQQLPVSWWTEAQRQQQHGVSEEVLC
jgi:hypothetical protein